MSTIAEFLKESDIFGQLTQTQLEMVANICNEQRYSAGEVIFEENSDSKELYVIVRGEIEILISPTTGALAKEKHQIAVLRHGQSFGEVALVDEGLRSAAAPAIPTQGSLTQLTLPTNRYV